MEECITSLLCQTESIDEIILINDGSTDGSREICEKYCRLYPNIILISQENQGLAAARNVGLKKTTGDYVIFVDSDDYIKKDACSIIKNILSLRKPEILYYNADIQYDISTSEREDAFRHISELNDCCMTGMKYFEKVFPLYYTASVCVAAYNRSFLKKHNIVFPEGLYFEDGFFSLQVISNARKIEGIKDSLYVRRCRENSIMTSCMTEKKCKDLVTNQRLAWEYLNKNRNWACYEELLRRFVSFGILQTFFELYKYKDRKLAVRLRHKLIHSFFAYCFLWFREENKSWESSLAYILILKDLLLNADEYKDIIRKYYESETGLYRELDKLESKVQGQCFEKLSSLPLGKKNVKVGVYGIGKHTQILLDLYQKNVGAIQAECFFIVSSEGDAQKFLNRKVYTYMEIPEDMNYAVVSSYIYQRKMYEKLLEQKIKKEKIVLFYTETSVCDLIMYKWVMDY